ncbi:ethylene-responsive transcription factor ERF017-like [Diospyros lotus]|uniref:ethylene-responsive transcription factor ERF017-like n=1 Tax=Diospyros lotus TaxID=55363 RepID=UPI00225B1468|nr:ethylene-responsive transcription factor ERF017-like [Diospyros lotus]
MVRPEEEAMAAERSSDGHGATRYKGVRKRKWGKWVSEIRLPNSRDRIWLGSYDSPEKAARAFDAALFCLRGPSANFNFPDNPPHIPSGGSLSSAEIQVAAARFANFQSQTSNYSAHRSSSSSSSSSSTSEMHARLESLSPSVCCGVGTGQVGGMVDRTFLNHFAGMGPSDNTNPAPLAASFDAFPEFDDFSNDFFVPPLPGATDYGEETSDGACTHDSFLWNF